MNGMDLKLDRIKKGIKAEKVAEVLKVSNSYVSYMENNKKPIPSELLVKWKSFLGNIG